MCAVNKESELIEFVFDSFYVDLQNDEIYLTFTAGSVCFRGACSNVVVFGLSIEIVLAPYLDGVVVATVMRVLLFVLHV